MMTPRNIRVLGVPLDLGQRRRGVDMGPSALRAARLQASLRSLGHTVEDAGDLPVVIPETQPEGDSQARFLGEIADVCGATAQRVGGFLSRGETPFVIGGDHSIAIGTAAGVSSELASRNEKLGLLWFDAHADMNTPETTPSGNVHGMALAAITGLGPAPLSNLINRSPIVEPAHVALIGVRDIDAAEKPNVRDSGIHVFTMRDIDELGIRTVVERALKIILRGATGIHVSLDMDFIDPSEAPGVGTPVPGGVTYREAHLAMELIADAGCMTSFEVAEVNPILDTANRTGKLAVELAMSVFGKRIL
ncbi:MAG: arginase [Acidobacteria bacterium]|nr:arginase [Acidobacteriota bacterium]